MPACPLQSHTELASLWAISQKLWNKQYSEVYPVAQATTWPPHIAPIVSALISEWGMGENGCLMLYPLSLFMIRAQGGMCGVCYGTCFRLFMAILWLFSCELL